MKNEIMASRLRELRGQRSREYVSIACKISVSALAMYENGSRVPRDEVKLRIAKFYNSSVESIFFIQEVHESCTCKTDDEPKKAG